MSNINSSQYWKEVQDLAVIIAEDAMSQCDNNRSEAEELITDSLMHETIGAHQWVIYNAYNLDVLQYSDNSEYYIDNFGADDTAIVLKEKRIAIMSKLAEVQKNIVYQWEKMIASGRIPVLEYQIGEDDFLQVDLALVDDGAAILFSFDRHPFPTADVWFSGDVVPVLDNFQITIDEYNDKLDIYLQQIDQEMLEGFILPNGLYYCED